jgi:hypothetical protein
VARRFFGWQRKNSHDNDVTFSSLEGFDQEWRRIEQTMEVEDESR